MRIILFIWEELGKYVQEIDWQEVTAIVSRTEPTGNERRYIRLRHGEHELRVPVISRIELPQQNYDYLVILSQEHFWEAALPMSCQGLADYYKIITLDFYRRHKKDNLFVRPALEQQIVQQIAASGPYSVLDADAFFAQTVYFTRQNRHFAPLHEIAIDGGGAEAEALQPTRRNFYRQIVGAQDMASARWDMRVFTRWRTVEEYTGMIADSIQKAEFSLFYLPWTKEKAVGILQLSRYDGPCSIHQSDAPFGSWLLLQRHQRLSGRVRLYVVAHKPFQRPFEDTDGIYCTIQAGRACHEAMSGCIGDDTGDNISRLNPFLNECTALYWFWRHSEASYIGLVHYRRYFLGGTETGKPKFLREGEVLRLMGSYDLLVSEQNAVYYPRAVWQIIQYDIGAALYRKVREEIEQLLEERQPEYTEAFRDVMEGHAFYPFQMFVMRRDVLQRYASWLFSFLPDLVNRVELQTAEGKQQRACGYFAERMLTVWLMRQDLRIKELPVVEIR